MGKSFRRKCLSQFLFIIFTFSIFTVLLYCITLSATNFVKSVHSPKPNSNSFNFYGYSNETITEVTGDFTDPAKQIDVSYKVSTQLERVDSLPIVENRSNPVTKEPSLDSCLGRSIYVYNLPSRFNNDLLENCQSLLVWTDMCQYICNEGLGPQLANSEQFFSSNKSWFSTNQFLLEVIFHNRMKQYKCLTNDSTSASAIFVPFYAGLEVGRNLWGVNNIAERDSASLDLIEWLVNQKEWKTMWGRDHFLVLGRIAWDFRRETDNESDWGNKLMFLPESKNMTMLSIESSHWNNDFAIPYPTNFHPSNNIQVFQWQNRMRRQKRKVLFCFVGAPRPNNQYSIRGEIINQCLASRKKCKLLDCNHSSANNCNDPVNVMKMFQNSVFCLQPSGDSYTRRSTFDSILAGCIPVFFNPRSAYSQYIWHLPKNYTKYSVFIPENSIKDGKVSIKKVLFRISKEEVLALREEVIRLIPRLIYANPRESVESFEDAFDVAVKGVLERVERIRRDISEGRSSGFDFGEKSSLGELELKYEQFGRVGIKICMGIWDSSFSKTKNGKLFHGLK